MLKPVITATALVALAGSSFAIAQHGFGGDRGFGDGGPRAEHRHHLSAADISAFADARIAAMKAGLQLTPIKPIIGRRSSRPCAISFSCGSNACKRAKPANSSSQTRPLIGSRAAPTIWPRPAPR